MYQVGLLDNGKIFWCTLKYVKLIFEILYKELQQISLNINFLFKLSMTDSF